MPVRSPRAHSSRFLVALLTAIIALPALAARAPDPEKARRFVEELLLAISQGADAQALEPVFAPGDGQDLHPGQRRAWLAQLDVELSQGSLGRSLSAQPEIHGVVQGPDYVRVVLETEPALSTRVIREQGELLSRGFEPAVCDLCPEPERFVRELLDRIQLYEQPRRLVAGADLHVDAKAEYPPDPGAFLLAWHNRNIDAGYLRWLLMDAQVVGSTGTDVKVSMRDRTESWPVVYKGGRWMLDYAGLPADSPLRLDPESVGPWHSGRILEDNATQWWLPSMRQTPAGLVVAEDVLYLAPRPVQGDVLAYIQPLDRTFSLLALMDEDGEVHARFSVPTLSRQQNFSQRRWRELFRFSLSADGRLLAVGAWDRMWVIRVDDGEVLAERYGLSGLDVLAWSPDGQTLIAADHLVLLELDPQTLRDRSRRPLSKPLVGAAFGLEELWVVNRSGLVERLDTPGLDPIGEDTEACCGAARSCTLDPASDELLVSCTLSCQPAWLWSWDGQAPPAQLADDGFAGEIGALALDPSGRLLVGPSADSAGALYDRRREESVGAFGGPVPLRHAVWSADGQMLYGVDNLGVGWRWTREQLLKP